MIHHSCLYRFVITAAYRACHASDMIIYCVAEANENIFAYNFIRINLIRVPHIPALSRSKQYFASLKNLGKLVGCFAIGALHAHYAYLFRRQFPAVD